MKKYKRKCCCCGQEFETESRNKTLCPQCCEKPKIKRLRQRERAKDNLDLLTVCRIIEDYNQRHHTRFTYGTFPKKFLNGGN